MPKHFHARFQPARRVAEAALALCLLTAGGSAIARDVFPPTGPDVLQTPTLTMLDPEFNRDKKLLTWVDVVSGDIWVASYDYTTGNFIPANGQGTLIEAGVSTGGQYPGLGFTINGPEWAQGTPTDYIVYTRTNATTGDPTPANALIGVAYQNPDSTWTRKSLSTPQRNGPYGSISRNGAAKISYQDAFGSHYVRTLTDANSEVPLPLLTKTGLTPVARFVDNANVVVYQGAINGVAQSVAYNIDSAVLTQLTFDATPKDQSWMWSAPEFDGALGLVNITGRSTITMYAPVVDGNGATTYQVYGTATAPKGGTWFSLEPFAYQGRTYMLAQLQPRGASFPTSIWMAAFGPRGAILRQLTPDGVSAEARADAEFLPISTGVLIVYSKFDTTKCTPDNVSNWLCMQGLMGLYRADTGLPAPH